MADGRLRRELGVPGATMLGLGSILGTGVFVSIGIAAGAAGPAVIPAVALAALLAACNALSSAELAAVHPVSGGAYEYGYRLLRPELGFTAGWMFLCAKTASAATAALGAAGYGLRLLGAEAGGWLPAIGCAVALAMTALVLGGLRRSSLANTVIVSVTLAALVSFATAGLLNPADGAQAYFTPFFPDAEEGGISSFFYAVALMFVAYTGYGRIATMGEEVRRPAVTIPRAIVATLIVSSLLYVLVATAAIGAVGADALAGAAGSNATPLETAAAALDGPVLGRIVAIGAVTAMLGVLLNLVLGLSRMALAMGRRGDLPPVLAGLSGRAGPRAAVLAVGLAIAGLALTGDVETTWSFSAFTVLIYYAVTNLAALRLPRPQRLYSPLAPWCGLGGCLFLTLFLPTAIWLTGLGLIALGLVWRRLAARLWPDAEGRAGDGQGFRD